jgi:hypothetical protein
MHITIDPTQAANGGYTAGLVSKTKQLLGGCSTDSSQPKHAFTLRVAPAAPTGVAAQLTGSRQITVTWNQGPEFDLQRYLLYNASTGAVLTQVPPNDSNFCSSSSCAVPINYTNPQISGPQSFSVTALRPDGSGSSLESAQSSSATTTLPPPPSPAPSPGGGGGGGGGGSGGGTGGGGSGGGGGGGSGGGTGGGSFGGGGGGTGSSGGIAIGRTSGLTFRPSAGNVLLPPPPPPAIAAPGLDQNPAIGSTPDGPFKQTLPYGTKYGYQKVTHRNAAQRAFHDVTTAFNGPHMARSLAIAFLLLLAGGHLRVWLRRPVD